MVWKAKRSARFWALK